MIDHRAIPQISTEAAEEVRLMLDMIRNAILKDTTRISWEAAEELIELMETVGYDKLNKMHSGGTHLIQLRSGVTL